METQKIYPLDSPEGQRELKQLENIASDAKGDFLMDFGLGLVGATGTAYFAKGLSDQTGYEIPVNEMVQVGVSTLPLLVNSAIGRSVGRLVATRMNEEDNNYSITGAGRIGAGIGMALTGLVAGVGYCAGRGIGYFMD